VLELQQQPEESVLREVWEETGVRVEAEKLTGVYKNMTMGVVALVFRCRIASGEVRTSDETAAVEWLTLAEVEKWMSEAYAVRVLDALTSGEPHVRAHDGRQLISRSS
jgi:8-oxo-dGTP diphosphatase